jgi:DNA-binding NtrC family response regulator
MTMPDMSGAVTLTEILRIRPGMPVVLSSGYAQDDTQGAQPLATGFIHKPYRPEQLVETMARVLG